MKCYFCSDLHLDKYCDLLNLETFEKFINNNLLPAEVLLIAGDIANNKNLLIQFMKIVSSKYKYVLYVLGNHDLDVRKNKYNEKVAKYYCQSIEKINNIDLELKKYTNVIRLDGSNITEINNIIFGGTMGMCDFTFSENRLNLPKEFSLCEWDNWYDNKIWNYLNNDPLAILEDEQKKLDIIVKNKPKIILTHFVPIEVGILPKYKDYMSSSFFYFEAKKYLDQLDNNTIWLCGHTHDAAKVGYINESSNIINILINPIGYPWEYPHQANNLESNDFLIDI